jgi:hypothetical protein
MRLNSGQTRCCVAGTPRSASTDRVSSAKPKGERYKQDPRSSPLMAGPGSGGMSRGTRLEAQSGGLTMRLRYGGCLGRPAVRGPPIADKHVQVRDVSLIALRLALQRGECSVNPAKADRRGG